MQRQYTGTSGKIDNCQLGVFAAYTSVWGRALIDRELYLPRSWFDDPGRLAAAGAGEEVEFATKPQLGLAMVERAVAAATPLGWVAADEAFGDNPGFRAGLEELRLPYVVAVSRDHRVTAAGRPQRVDALVAAAVADAGWQRMSCGDGAKGPRYFDWALLGVDHPAYRILARRSPSDGEVAYYLSPRRPRRGPKQMKTALLLLPSAPIVIGATSSAPSIACSNFSPGNPERAPPTPSPRSRSAARAELGDSRSITARSPLRTCRHVPR